MPRIANHQPTIITTAGYHVHICSMFCCPISAFARQPRNLKVIFDPCHLIIVSGVEHLHASAGGSVWWFRVGSLFWWKTETALSLVTKKTAKSSKRSHSGKFMDMSHELDFQLGSQKDCNIGNFQLLYIGAFRGLNILKYQRLNVDWSRVANQKHFRCFPLALNMK